MLGHSLLTTVLLISSGQAAPHYGAFEPAAAGRAPSPIECHVESALVWDTVYVETEEKECQTVYVNKCQTLHRNKCYPVSRQECFTVEEEQCATEYRQQCRQEVRSKVEHFTETECSVQYKDDCEFQWEGEGAAKVWVPIPGTCVKNPYEECHDVPRQRTVQVPYEKCDQVPEQRCVNVPRRQCRTVTEQKCDKEPYQKCDSVPKSDCNTVHKKVPTRVSRRVQKKVCNNAGGQQQVPDNTAVVIDVRGGNHEQLEKELQRDSDAIRFED